MQSLLKKQDLFETEVKVHSERVSNIELSGKELIDQVLHADVVFSVQYIFTNVCIIY